MSERPSRQRHFPARKRLVRPQIRPKFTRQLRESQSTLTQLNYVTPTPNDPIDKDLSEIDEAEFSGSTSRKRRKVAPIKTRSERQSTLTQWEWFEDRHLSDSDEAEKENYSEHIAQNVDNSTTKPSPPLSYTPSSPKLSASEEILDLPQPVSIDPQFRTPQKSVKTEIPSSQSPAVTPIDTQQTPRSVSSNKTVYTPPTNLSPPGPRYAGESPLRGKYTGIPRKLEDQQKLPEGSSKGDAQPQKWSIGIEPHSPSSNQTSKNKTIKPATESAKTYHKSRSSQATTVDLSQSSPEASRKRPPVQGRQKSCQSLKSRGVDFHGASTSSPPYPRAPSPMPPESQFPLPISSDVDGVDYTPLQPLENSDDLPTISQLLPESMR